MEKAESVASIKIYGKIISNDKKVDGRFEESINFVLTKEQINNLDILPYQKIFDLPEGKYTLTFVAMDTQKDIAGISIIKFEVN